MCVLNLNPQCLSGIVVPPSGRGLPEALGFILSTADTKQNKDEAEHGDTCNPSPCRDRRVTYAF